MSDDGFERELRDAAQRVAGGRASEALHVRVAAISATDRRPAVPWSRSTAATRVAVSVVAMLVVASVTLLIVTRRPDVGTVPAASGTTAPITSSPTTAAPTTAAPTVGSALVTRTFGTLSIVMPANWQVVSPVVWARPVGPFLFLSDTPIADPCPTAFATGDVCWMPLAALPPDGILVTLGGSAFPVPPTPVSVLPLTDTCRALGGEKQLGAGFTGFGVSACLRGPDLATNEALFRSMVDSIHP
jgi:hypothetical protein